MNQQLLNSDWCDKSKSNCLDTIAPYAEYQGISYIRPKFRPYDDREMYVPSPDIVKQFLYRIRSIPVRAMILLPVENGCSVKVDE